MKIDVALTHASCADPFGNVQYDGNPFVDALIQKAAEKTIATVEKIVPSEFIRRNPFKTVYKADHIVRAPFGGHPYSCHNAYVEDEEHLKAYATAAFMAGQGDESAWHAYRSRYIDAPADHLAYLEAVGLRRLFSLYEY
jgi:glutaconate CoA-transferase, subunit A